MRTQHVSQEQMGDFNSGRDASERRRARLVHLQGSAVVHPFAACNFAHSWLQTFRREHAYTFPAGKRYLSISTTPQV